MHCPLSLAILMLKTSALSDPRGPGQGPRSCWPPTFLWTVGLLASSQCYFLLGLSHSLVPARASSHSPEPSISTLVWLMRASCVPQEPVGCSWSLWFGCALLPKPFTAPLRCCPAPVQESSEPAFSAPDPVGFTDSFSFLPVIIQLLALSTRHLALPVHFLMCFFPQ